MICFLLMQVFSTLLQIVLVGRQSERDKDLEILLLLRQLAILERHHTQRVLIWRADKLTLTVLVTSLRAVSGWPMKRLKTVLRIIQPETVLKWHRELVRGKWTWQPKVAPEAQPRRASAHRTRA